MAFAEALLMHGSQMAESSSSVVVEHQSYPVRLAYQPRVSSTFLSKQTSHQQPASSTFLSEQTSTRHQPNEQAGYCIDRLGW
jgi:hypothetical protein